MIVPENEMGVIVRFSHEIASMDNVSIASIRAQYPDAILHVHGKEIRVEFEYIASNFISHQHDPRECDLVICWINDVKHRNMLPTWELSGSGWRSLEVAEVSFSKREALYWEIRARRAERAEKRARNLMSKVNVPAPPSMEDIKLLVLEELGLPKPNITQLAQRLGIGRTSLYRHIGTLVGTGEVIKNGNGYELPRKEISDAKDTSSAN